MRSFFDKNGEYAPNKDDLVQLPAIYTKKALYNIFCRHVTESETADEHEIVSESNFMEIWRRCFPNVKITKFVAVCGKCQTCWWIYEKEGRQALKVTIPLFLSLVTPSLSPP